MHVSIVFAIRKYSDEVMCDVVLIYGSHLTIRSEGDS